MLESLQQFGRELGRELSRAWDSLSEGWRELLTRSSNALTRFTRKNEEPAGTVEVEAAGAPRWGLLAGDVYDAGDRLLVRLELPGVAKEDCEIVVDGNTLWVRGEKRYEREHVGGSFYLRQCAYGSFERAIGLPHQVDASRADAKFSDGVLTVTLPKSATPGPRKISVR
jgi:HSP20 family protein